MTPGRSAALAREVAPDRVSAGHEREITVDRSNDCVVVDEAVFVKWLTPPVAEPHQGLDIVRHLAAVGFDAMPAIARLRRWSDGGCKRSCSNTSPGRRTVGRGCSSTSTPSMTAALPGAELLADAARLGTLGGRTAAALATPIGDHARHRSARSTAAPSALAGTPCSPPALDEVDARDQPEAHAVLHAGRPTIEQLIDSIPDGPTPAFPIHGDLHVGQVLRSGDRMVVIDFDGNPLLIDGAPVTAAACRRRRIAGPVGGSRRPHDAAPPSRP